MSRAAAVRAPTIAAQRTVLYAAVAVTAGAAWMYQIAAAGRMHQTATAFVATASMWAAMTLGMMLPAAVPMFAAYAGVSAREPGRHLRRLFAFVAAYLALWFAVSLAGAAAQQRLSAAGFLSHAGASVRPAISSALLLAAGAYQFTPWKDACLRRCRTPLGFLLAEFRPGVPGALRLGLLHGRDCIVCCWMLMALAFVLGTMHVVWMAALAAVMIAEKAAPGGRFLGRVFGVVCVAWGLLLLA